MSALSLHDVTVQARDGTASRVILHLSRLELPSGAQVGICGASGSGKTTLLRVLSGLRVPHTGSVRWEKHDITQLGEAARDAWRGQTIGFVFQDFRLFAALNALDNVLVPATFRHWRIPQALRDHAVKLLDSMDIREPRQSVNSLSRGEQQRVAVARALLFHPSILLADEPTASLDTTNARIVMDALQAYAAAKKSTLFVVSHDPLALDRLPLRLRLERGCMSEAV